MFNSTPKLPFIARHPLIVVGAAIAATAFVVMRLQRNTMAAVMTVAQAHADAHEDQTERIEIFLDEMDRLARLYQERERLETEK